MKQINNNEKKAKILVVEDNQESVDLLVYFLKPAGYEITTAINGMDAIQIVEKSPPDIILLDVMLPKLNGYEVCERIKKNSRTFYIPVVMITALKELKDKIRALEAGADDFISKPFDSVELLARVKSLLRLKAYHDELIRRNKELAKQKQILLREDMLKKELTNLIVHDMKNPLFVIQGNLQMMSLEKRAGHSNVDEKYTQRIERSSKGLLRMILNLLDISRFEQNTVDLEAIPVDLSKLVKEVVDYFSDIPENARKRVKLEMSTGLPSANLDKNVFERIFDNLFNYIYQNSPDNSTIVAMIEQKKDGYLYLKITHKGKPIPQEFHQKIFKKFAQAELRVAGFKPARGLGLIFCKFGLEAHGGDIYLEPNIKDGNCFVLKIPALIKKNQERMVNANLTEN
jgi:DNA-binding response OmpR family regulator